MTTTSLLLVFVLAWGAHAQCDRVSPCPSQAVGDVAACYFGCACADATVFNYTCSLQFQYPTFSNATFHWLVIAPNSSVSSNFSISSVVGGSRDVAWQNATNGTIALAGSRAFSSPKLFIEESLQFGSYGSVSGGVMPCTPGFGASTFTDLTFRFTAARIPGLNASLVNLSAYVKGIGDGPEGDWQLVQSNVPYGSQVTYTAPGWQCQSSYFMWSTVLNVPGVPAVTCAQNSTARSVLFSKPPSAPTIVSLVANATTDNCTTNVTVVWLPSADNGGCTDVTYELTMLSQWVADLPSYRSTTVVLSTKDAQIWHVPYVPLSAQIQYLVIIDPKTTTGPGTREYSVSFSPPPYNATNCPNPTPTPSGSSSGLSSVQIVGISIAAAAVLVGFSILVYRRYARRRQAAYEALN